MFDDAYIYGLIEILNTVAPVFKWSITDSRADFKRKLASMMFRNDGFFRDAKTQVEDFLHPKIFKKMNQIIFSSNSDKIIVQVPLLYETGTQKLFDKVICVWTSEQEQINRMVKNRGMTVEEAKARITSQMAINEKMKLADYCISNNLDLKELVISAKFWANEIDNEGK